MKTKTWLLALILVPHLGSQLLAQSVSVPTSDGRPVMTDGILEAAEWGDAYQLAIGEAAKFLVKEYRGHVFVGVDCGKLGKPFVVNLYLKAPGGRDSPAACFGPARGASPGNGRGGGPAMGLG